MCGIIGFSGARQAAPILLSGLKTLEYRGYDSAGIAVLGEKEIRSLKVKGRIGELEKQSDGGRLLPGTTGMGHTRWATHGEPSEVNAHPQFSSDGSFAVVHNGIIENYAELKAMLESKGVTFRSETDTEVIAQLLAYCYRGDVRVAMAEALPMLRGAYALGILCAHESEKIFFARSRSPLLVGLGIGEGFFASDAMALTPYTKTIINLQDGDMGELSGNQVTFFDASLHLLERKSDDRLRESFYSEKGSYDSFMAKEIAEQPGAMRTMLRTYENGEAIPFTGEELRSFRRVVLTGCGSASYAAQAGRYALEQLCGWNVSVVLASELRYDQTRWDEHCLLIAISQSGETADTLAALEEAKAGGARTLSIVNVPGSTLSRESEFVLYTYAGPEIAVATTKGYTTQLMALYLLSLHFGRRMGTLKEKCFGDLMKELKALPERALRVLDLDELIKRIAVNFTACSSVFFMGRSIDWAVSMEGALKLKELSYIHAEAYAAGELKHGSIALIEPGTQVVALCCQKRLLEKMHSNIRELKARGARVLALLPQGVEELNGLCEDSICLPECEPLFYPALEVIPLQLLACYTAQMRGCDIDKPRNLAKSVTVE